MFRSQLSCQSFLHSDTFPFSALVSSGPQAYPSLPWAHAEAGRGDEWAPGCRGVPGQQSLVPASSTGPEFFRTGSWDVSSHSAVACLGDRARELGRRTTARGPNPAGFRQPDVFSKVRSRILFHDMGKVYEIPRPLFTPIRLLLSMATFAPQRWTRAGLQRQVKNIGFLACTEKGR